MADANIETLSIEIESDASQAKSGIEALASSLSQLKTAVSGFGSLKTVANGVSAMADAANKLTGTGVANLTALGNALTNLSGVGTIKFGSTASNLTNLNAAVASVDWTANEKLTDLATGLRDLAGVGTVKFGSSINNIKKLSEAVDTLNAADLDKFTQNAEKLAVAMRSLGSAATEVKGNLGSMPSTLNKATSATKTYSSAVDGASFSLSSFAAKFGFAFSGATVGLGISKAVNEYNEYVETMNRASVSLDNFAEQADKTSKAVYKALGINPAEYLGNMATYQTIVKGFGVVEDKAYTMSKGLTNLGYDIASFYDISVADATQKLTSAISGELEPVRRLGYDLSQTRLQQVALEQGITKTYSAMTQAEKSQLRYIALMQQSTLAQGDMARTLTSPANQLRVLRSQLVMTAQAIGGLFIPIVNKVIPYLLAFLKVIVNVINALRSIFGMGKMATVDFSSGIGEAAGAVDGLNDSVGDTSSGLGDANKAAEKLKKTILGFDELNIMNSADTSSSTGSGSGGSGGISGVGGGGDLGLDLSQFDYDFFDDAISNNVDKIVTEIERLLPLIAAIGAGFASWKIGTSVIKFLDKLENLRSLGKFDIGSLTGLAGLATSLGAFLNAIKEIQEEGKSFSNVLQIISTFVSGIGFVISANGNIKLGGIVTMIGGLGQIVAQIKEISEEGVNFDNVSDLIVGIGQVMSGLMIFTGNWKGAGIAIGITSAVQIIQFFHDNWEHIKNLEWSEIDWTQLVFPAAAFAIGIASFMGKFDGLGGHIAKGSTVKTTIDTATTQMGDIGTAIGTESSGGLATKLKSLATALGWGVVIVAEVAAAALIFVGAIALIGYELQAVNDAWDPVIDNGQNTITAVAIGAGILGGVGLVTYGLGTLGKTAAINMGIGIVVLAEIAAASLLFVGSIILLGVALQKVADTWDPVIEKSETVKTAIAVGTGLLVAVGVVTFAIGTATVGTGGTIALAIGAGTAVMAEIAGATILFVKEIQAVGKELQRVGDEWQPINEDGEDIREGIEKGTEMLIAIGAVTAALGVATVATGGLLPAAIGLGTGMLVEVSTATILFIESLAAVATSLKDDLAPDVADLNTVLPDLNTDLSDFVTFMETFAGYAVSYSKSTSVSGLSSAVSTIVGWFTDDPLETLAKDVKKVGKQASSLNGKLDEAVPEVEYAVEMLTSYKTGLEELSNLTGASFSIPDSIYVDMKDAGKKLVTGFADGITEKSSEIVTAMTNLDNGIAAKISTMDKTNTSSMKNFATALVKAFTDNVKSNSFSSTMTTAVSGVNNAISNGSSTSTSSVQNWARNIKSTFTSYVTYNSFYNSAVYAVNGFNNGIARNGSTSNSWVAAWANGIVNTFRSRLNIHSPSRVFAEMGGYTVEGYNEGIEDESATTQKVMADWVEGFMGVVKDASAFDMNELMSPTVSAVSQHAVNLSEDMTANMNYDTIADGVREGMSVSSDRQSDLIRQQITLLQELLDKDVTVEVTANSIEKAKARQARRAGVAVG